MVPVNFKNQSYAPQMLLEDCNGFAVLDLNESVGGTTKFRGKFQEANTVNKNKRLYPFEVLAENVKKLIETVNSRGLYGELDHPTDSIVHLANTSHIVTRLWWDGNVLMGEGEILNTPSGKVLKSLVEARGRIGISSRGVGNGQVNNEGVLVIGESYKLITFDAVADPSTFEAFQEEIVKPKKESVETRPVMDVQKVPLKTLKNEANCIHKVNANTLIPYCGHLIEKYTRELKERLS